MGTHCYKKGRRPPDDYVQTFARFREKMQAEHTTKIVKYLTVTIVLIGKTRSSASSPRQSKTHTPTPNSPT